MIPTAACETHGFFVVAQSPPKDDCEGADDANGKRWCVSDHLWLLSAVVSYQSCCELQLFVEAAQREVAFLRKVAMGCV